MLANLRWREDYDEKTREMLWEEFRACQIKNARVTKIEATTTALNRSLTDG